MARDARARLARIEAKLHPAAPAIGKLSGVKRRELVELENAYRSRFPSDDVDEWSTHDLDDYLLSYTPSEAARRLAELRHRALPPREQAELRANEIAIAAMTADELDQWMAEMTRAAQEN